MENFLNMLKEFFTSKKAIAMLIGIIVTLLVEFVPTLAGMEDKLLEILGLIAAYILGQGIADFGKHSGTEPL